MLAQSLVHVPLSRAADASGVLTTALQLASAAGVAIFGTVFLSLGGNAGRIASATALSTTLAFGLAALAVVGIVPASALSRTLLRANRHPT